MHNRYKIDCNSYISRSFPFALYLKRPSWFKKWEYLGSYPTVEEATEDYKRLTVPLPIMLGED